MDLGEAGPDIRVDNHGTVVLLVPLTKAGNAWVRKHVQAEDWQWFGGGLACEPRYVGDVIEGLQEDDLWVQIGGR